VVTEFLASAAEVVARANRTTVAEADNLHLFAAIAGELVHCLLAAGDLLHDDCAGEQATQLIDLASDRRLIFFDRCQLEHLLQ
jgi:hypothetical protein